MRDARTKKAGGWGAAFLVAALVVGGAALYVKASLSFAYSSGARVGFVQKVSESGWLCKTYRGDLAMSTAPGQTHESFAFIVRDRAVAGRIDELAGHRVVLQYEQRKGIPSPCFGETEYFATGVRRID